jgi:uncharacterized protein (TIGR02284 family)
MNDYDAISVLDNLVETCKNGEEGFKTAAEALEKNSSLKSTLEQYSQQRASFAEELNGLVTNFGGSRKDSGTVAGTLHQGWINLKAAVTGGDEGSILSECERGEDAAKEAYQSALENPMPPEVATVVRRQFEAILEAHRTIKGLRDSANNQTSTATSGS